MTEQTKEKTRVKRNLIILVGVALGIFITDQAIKIALKNAFEVGTHGIAQVFGLIRIDYVLNTGAAWSMFSGNAFFLGILGVIIVAIIGYAATKEAQNASALEMVGFGLVIAGAIGNIVDRFAYGAVIDFITLLFIDFPTFNIADMGITCGIVLIVIAFIFQMMSQRPQQTQDDYADHGKDDEHAHVESRPVQCDNAPEKNQTKQERNDAGKQITASQEHDNARKRGQEVQ